MSTRRVVVTGLGVVSPLALTTSATWSSLITSTSSLTSVATRGPPFSQLTSTVAGVVPPSWADQTVISAADRRRMARFTQYAVVAADEALRDAGWWPEREGEGAERTGVAIGNGIGGFEEINDSAIAFVNGGQRKVSPLFVPLALPNMAAGHIAIRFGFRGPGDCHSTACTTGADSIGSAHRAILNGDADVMVTGGAESCIHPLVFAGFGRARSLSTGFNGVPEESCRPFDKRRDGFVLAEGAAVLILEELEHAKWRGARIYAEIKGYGRSMDAHHMTAPREDGRGAFLSMKRALDQAGIKPQDVSYINAHATGTRVGDAAEAWAIATLLGADGIKKTWVSGTKSATGHLLGAAGALEAIFAIKAVEEGIVPPTLNLTEPDVGVDLRFVGPTAEKGDVRVAISNSFGFGGMNASLVFTRVD